MKCQACDKPATHHVTELVAGKPVEYHVCEHHAESVAELKPAALSRGFPYPRFWVEFDSTSREKLAAYLLPPLCIALLDPQPGVRILAAWSLIMLAPNARSAIGALRDALRDPDERVRRAAELAIKAIGAEPELPAGPPGPR
jgi:hypothetical protein